MIRNRNRTADLKSFVGMNDPFHLFLNLHANLDGHFHTFLLWLKIGDLWISLSSVFNKCLV